MTGGFKKKRRKLIHLKNLLDRFNYIRENNYDTITAIIYKVSDLKYQSCGHFFDISDDTTGMKICIFI